ncbi:integrase arm-type DNA-binding domain-containing protein [Serratia odorifera]|nr:integrase arm-type DNA-binding domain-containing protein [Serratia odorifera]
MARTARLITDTAVQKAKAIEKDLTLHNGDGLFLLVKTTGKKLWRFRYLRPGSSSRTMVSLGAYPALSLADARQIRAEKLAILARGIDPQAKEAAEAEQKQVAQESIFLNVAKQWFALKQVNCTV